MTKPLTKQKANFRSLANVLKNSMSIQRVFKDNQSQTHSSLHHPRYFLAYYHPHNLINLHHYYHPSYHQKQHSLEKDLDPPEKIQIEKKLLS